MHHYGPEAAARGSVGLTPTSEVRDMRHPAHSVLRVSNRNCSLLDPFAPMQKRLRAEPVQSVAGLDRAM